MRARQASGKCCARPHGSCASVPPRLLRIGGWTFAEDPELPAHRACLFWNEALDGSVIPALAKPGPVAGANSFDIRQSPWPVTILQCDGREEVAISMPYGTTRLSLRAGSLMEGPVRLQYLLEGPRLHERLLALQRWDRSLRTGAAPKSAMSSMRETRWPLLIATINVLGDGCSLREAAICLFGAQIVARDWGHESDYLKLRTRRLVAQARALLAGGYRDLL